MTDDTDWLSILSSLELQAASVEALLASSPLRPQNVTEISWQWESLAKLTDLPQIPAELQARAVQVRDHIITLQKRLTHEIEEYEASVPLLTHPRTKAAPQLRSAYIDVTV